jgi:hypothetical protein
MDNYTLLMIMTSFIVKHFVVDFLLQTKYQYANKHILGHPGGLLHSWLHSVVTIIIIGHFFPVFDYKILTAIGLFDFVLHYVTDWLKMNINIKMNWKADNSPFFWWLMGLDQLIHYMTYVIILYLLLTLI